MNISAAGLAARRANIIKRYEDGERVKSICASYGCTQQNIYRILRKNRVVKPDRRGKWFVIAERYQAGESAITLCEEFKTNRKNFNNAMYRLRVPLRRPGRHLIAKSLKNPGDAGASLKTPQALVPLPPQVRDEPLQHSAAPAPPAPRATASVEVAYVPAPSKTLMMTGRAPRMPISLKGFPALLGRSE